MPGLFGAIGCSPNQGEQLRGHFSAPWGNCQAVRLPGGILGGHAFQNQKVLHILESGTHFVVDGERTIYHKAAADLFCFSPTLELSKTCKGNVAIATKNLWHLATDWSGSFPLYYAHTREGLLFCSRLRPIAQILRPEIDMVGLRQFLHASYMMSGRTFYRGVARLMPGQVLTYDPTCKRVSIDETSKAWVGLGQSSPSETWNGLIAAVSNSLDQDCSNAILMSGGWDSRTVLAAATQVVDAKNILAYYHGGQISFEKKVTTEVCHSLGVKFHHELLREELFDIDALKMGFDRTETVFFSAWHRAGLVLSASGADCVASGVFGECLGGHYGRTMFLHGARKVFNFLLQGLGQDSSKTNIFDALKIQNLVKPSLVRSEVFGNINELQNTINDDIDNSLRRFIARGVQTPDQLVEAFITEHRASQHISAQMLSCRAYLDVSLPFSDRGFFTLASRIPITSKLHNALNRRMLQQHLPEVLKAPTAAAPISAAMPIWVQELSRLVRHMVEERINLPPLSWYDWEFLRNGVVLNTIVDDMELDLWDKKIIRQRIAGLQEHKTASIGPLMQLLLIAWTVDLMLRNAPSSSPNPLDLPPISQTDPGRQ
ncbi:MAG: hypothetical protein JNK03_07085 [Nitrospira sp.]|nr:hypothetical protein [Nitrospira sp.]